MFLNQNLEKKRKLLLGKDKPCPDVPKKFAHFNFVQINGIPNKYSNFLYILQKKKKIPARSFTVIINSYVPIFLKLSSHQFQVTRNANEKTHLYVAKHGLLSWHRSDYANNNIIAVEQRR